MPDTDDLSPMSEIGSSGLRNFNGFVREEFLTELQGRNKYRIYNEMRNNDPVIGAMLTAIETMMRQSECKVERGPAQTEQADEAREFLRSVKHDIYPDWESTLSDILSFVWAGHSVHEIVYKRREGHKSNPVKSSRFDDGRIGVARLPIRQQETLWEWEFDGETGLVEGVYQREASGGNEVFIPSEKFINFKPKHSRQNPEGSSALRSSYKPYYFKKRIQEIESIGIERDLAGMPKATVPFEMLKDDANQDYQQTLDEVKNIVKNIRRDEQEGVVWPRLIDEESGEDLFDLELMSAGGERQFNIDDIVKRYDQRIAMTVLADFILIGHESVGSFALANQKTSSFALALEAWLGAIQNKLNNKLVPQLFRLNDFDLDEGEMPRFKFSEVETANLDALGSYMKNLFGAGFDFSEDQGIRDWLLEQAGAPLERNDDNSSDVEKQTDFNEGDWVQWNSAGGTAHGKIDEVVMNGCTTRGRGTLKVCAEDDDPATVVEVYNDETGESQNELVRHKMSSLREWTGPETEKQVDTVPTQEIADIAAQALEKYNDDELDNDDCGTRVGVERANQLQNREELSEETINRMVSFFSRHEGDEEINDDVDNKWEDCGYLTWQFWGGYAGREWAERKQEQLNDE